jgi:adenine-specific DNA-methyltransferase
LKNEVIIGDCADVLPSFPDKTFDLAILDPPYYKIKTDSWDRQWKTFSEYLDWLEAVCLEVKRVLKDNGSLYVFGDDQRIAYVQVRLDKHFTFLNHLIWYKRNNQSIKGAWDSRRYACVSERILFYGLQDQTGLETVMLDTNNFKTLRQYFKEFQEALGLKLKQINTILGHRKAEHAFYWGSTQWDLPTPETYQELLSLPRSETFEVREYEDLRREYEDLRRPFHYFDKMYEVFDIPIIGGKERTAHPTTKPKELYKRLIQCSTNEGALILDPFAGSGTSLIAAKETGRYCIAIEKEEKYLPIIQERGQLNSPSLEAFVK